MLQFLWGFLAAKWLAFSALLAGIWFLLECCNFFSFSLFLAVVSFAAEFVLYRAISLQSRWNLLKIGNFFAGFYLDELCENYLNLNLFGHPINSFAAAGVFLGCMLIGSTAALLWIYEKKKAEEKSFFLLRTEDCLHRLRDSFWKKMPRAALIGYKFFVVQLGIVVLFGVGAVSERLQIRVKSPETGMESLLELYYAELEGPCDSPDAAQWLEREWKELADAEEEFEEKEQQYADGTLGNLEWTLLQEKRKGIQVKHNAVEYLQHQVEEAAAYLEETGISLWLISRQVWKQLLEENRNTALRCRIYPILLVWGTVLAFFLSFSYEHESGMDQVLHISKKGNRAFFLRRQVLLTVMCLALWALVYGWDLVSVVRLYGISGLDAPVQSISGMKNVLWHVNLRTYLIFLNVLRFLNLWILAQLVQLISVCCRERKQALLYGVACFGIPVLLEGIGLMNGTVGLSGLLDSRTLLFNLASGNAAAFAAEGAWCLAAIVGICAAGRIWTHSGLFRGIRNFAVQTSEEGKQHGNRKKQG